MEELRPVGTEFDIIQSPDIHSPFPKRVVNKYRVIGHERGQWGQIVEEVKLIEIRDVQNE